jgi:carbonic anhydrase
LGLYRVADTAIVASTNDEVKKMSIEDLLQNNVAYATAFDKSDLPARPAKGLAVLTCMDARIDVHRVLGLQEGDAHVIRNAGGLVTEDAIRSLLLSQRVLSTNEVLVIQHTSCGMMNLPDEELKSEIREELGSAPPFELGGFSDLYESVRSAMAKIKESPFLGNAVRGFVYDVKTGRLEEIT